MFRTVFSFHYQESKTVHTASRICQTDSADCLLANSQQTERQSETCRVLQQNKFEKLVHLVSFTIEIYHDARPYKRQTKNIHSEYVIHIAFPR